MSVVKKTMFGGVTVKLGPYEHVKLKKGRLVSVAHFTCQCGVQEIRITEEDIKQAGRGPPGSPGYMGVKEYHDFTRQWNNFHERANKKGLDFIEYQRQLRLLHEKRRILSSRVDFMSKYSTTISLDCPICCRRYNIPLGISTSLESAPEFDLLHAYEALGFNLNNTVTKRVLAWCSFRLRFENTEKLLNHLQALADDHDFVSELVERLQDALNEFLENNQPKSENTQAWVRSISDSLTELNHEFTEDLDQRLRSYLNEIAEAAATWRELTE